MREFSLLFLDEPFELIGIFRGVHYRLIKRFSTTACGVYDNTKVRDAIKTAHPSIHDGEITGGLGGTQAQHPRDPLGLPIGLLTRHLSLGY